MTTLDLAMGLVRPASSSQFGDETEALVEGLATVVSFQLDAQRMEAEGKLYERDIMLADLCEMWDSLADQLARLRRRVPPESWN
jgi:hypothetical protein